MKNKTSTLEILVANPVTFLIGSGVCVFLIMYLVGLVFHNTTAHSLGVSASYFWGIILIFWFSSSFGHKWFHKENRK